MNGSHPCRSSRTLIPVGIIVSLLFLSVGAAGTGGPTEPARVETSVLDALKDSPKATYWVVLRERADLAPAKALLGEARGRFVMDRLQAVAERSQADLRSLLRARGADFFPFWAANVLKVTSDRATLDLLASRPEVEAIEADQVIPLPEPRPGVQEATVQAVEWNIANIRAQEVWSTFGTRGEGIIVGSIDTGAQFDHPALVGQYRGNLGSGGFDHNYNWYDPSLICGNPSLAPCDNNGHGTHTMGTIAGDDGAGNQIGVAPGVRWITAKGCESSSCTTTALVAAGQWMLAPTDLSGQNPRPDLRPNLVSNSWGDGPGNTFYQQIVQSWAAAGIFPVFANGNAGPSCGSVGSPGDYPESYGVGAYDSANLIASFSSRGASALGGITKPNISAPGVNVRSSYPSNTYVALSGTSMATPHVAGAVALMWSAAPALMGDIATTRQILDQTAIDTADNSCGGNAANNNVYGEGRMDVFAAVDQSPRGPTGRLQGTVTDAVSGAPLVGLRVNVTGPANRATTSGTNGGYSLTLPVGSYDVAASGFGYLTQTIPGVPVTEGGVTVQDIAMTPAPSHRLSGLVRDSEGTPVANARVAILGTPIPPATTDGGGAYQFPSVPEGTYNVTATAGRCNDPLTLPVVLDVDRILDFTLPLRTDAFGYSCKVVAPSWVDAATVLPLSGDDTFVQVSLPFTFEFYGGLSSTAFVSTNGFLTFFAGNASYANTSIPSTSVPNGAVYAFWDDLVVDASSSVRTQTLGQAPDLQFAVEWRNVAFYGNTTLRFDAEVVLHQTGGILVQYRNIAPGSSQAQGGSATLGLENAAGTIAYQYGFNEPVVSEGLALLYAVTPFTGAEGRVTDANDGLGIQGATVRALENGSSTQTDAAGYYRLLLPLGTHTVEAAAPGYGPRTATIVLTVLDQHVTQDFSLPTPRAEASPASLAFSAWVGQSVTLPLTISNTGGLNLHWQIAESGGDVTWLSETPAAGTLIPGGSQPVQVTVDATGLARGYYSATLLLQSDSGRRPSISVPVSLSVTQYDQAVNAGDGAYYDLYGVTWAADGAYVAGGWGYTNSASNVATTKHTISGTSDPTLFQSQRTSPGEYRFDGLPSGTYQVTVHFAEYKKLKLGTRVFDVAAEGTVYLAGHDIIRDVGVWAADTHTFTVTVTDGQLNLSFVARAGSQPPLVCAIRVLQTS